MALASPAGAGVRAWAVSEVVRAAAVEVTPRLASCSRSLSSARSTRMRAASSEVPRNAPTRAKVSCSKNRRTKASRSGFGRAESASSSSGAILDQSGSVEGERSCMAVSSRARRRTSERSAVLVTKRVCWYSHPANERAARTGLGRRPGSRTCRTRSVNTVWAMSAARAASPRLRRRAAEYTRSRWRRTSSPKAASEPVRENSCSSSELSGAFTSWERSRCVTNPNSGIARPRNGDRPLLPSGSGAQ